MTTRPDAPSVWVVDDDRSVRYVLAEALRDAGYRVQAFADADAALAAVADAESPDLVFTDVRMPGTSGLDFLVALRKKRADLPVVVMSAYTDVATTAGAFRGGAHDYLAKPFDLAELEARVRALTRRGMAGSPTLLHHGALKYDQIGRVATLNGAPLELSARELSLLEVFLQRAGRLVSKEQLVSHLCEWGEEVSPNAIEVYVHRLRKKLEPGGVRIVTVRGLGYSLEKSPEKTSAA